MPNYKRLFIQNSYLFLTITTYKRKPILIDNIGLLRESFRRAKQTYDFEIYASVILPEHMHLILIPKNINEYPKIVFAIKYHFSRNIPNDGGLGNPPYALTGSKIKKKEKGIWQRRYWEHTIMSKEDLHRHLDYIHYNPIKHNNAQRVKDWEFSSFYKFVKMGFYEESWYCLKNLEEILTMDLD